MQSPTCNYFLPIAALEEEACAFNIPVLARHKTSLVKSRQKPLRAHRTPCHVSRTSRRVSAQGLCVQVGRSNAAGLSGEWPWPFPRVAAPGGPALEGALAALLPVACPGIPHPRPPGTEIQGGGAVPAAGRAVWTMRGWDPAWREEGHRPQSSASGSSNSHRYLLSPKMRAERLAEPEGGGGQGRHSLPWLVGAPGQGWAVWEGVRPHQLCLPLPA